MKSLFKRAASLAPSSWQQQLKRLYFRRQLGKGHFITDEPEFDLLDQWVKEGDWVIDIGANIGHYTCRLSNLVGAAGRVISVEPVPETFELLAANVCALAHRNVTLLNVAAADHTSVLGMEVPKFDTGLNNYYRANLTEGEANLNVINIPLDALALPHAIRLVKIDVEGAELSALKGIASIIEKDHPVLIVEDNSEEISDHLQTYGYTSQHLAGSPNKLFTREA